MSSKDRPFVSGTKTNVQTNEKRQKTAKNVYAPNPVFCTKGGVMRPCRRQSHAVTIVEWVSSEQLTMMKLLSQLLAVERATPFPRRLDGNISEGIAHGLAMVGISDIRPWTRISTYTGPHDAPKLIM